MNVTQRIKEVKQPYGGYINPKKMEIIELDDAITLYETENISTALVGMTVDYMTRYIVSGEKEKSFDISLKGAEKINDVKYAYKLLDEVNGLDAQSIINACKLTGYDVCFRAGKDFYRDIDNIMPDENTIFNIRTMIKRSLNFFDKFGPIVSYGNTFRGGYGSIITSGDMDFTTSDTIWDFKVTKNEINKNHTLQLIIYYLLGIHSYECDFSKIKKIGIFNPRKNLVYQYKISEIPSDIIKEIEETVIGYNNYSNYNEKLEFLTITDIMRELECSRHMVMKYYTEFGLPLMKHKNKYVINKVDFMQWLAERVQQEEKQRTIAQFIIILTVVFSLLSIIALIGIMS